MLRSPLLTPLIIVLVAGLTAIAAGWTLLLASTTPWIGTSIVPHGEKIVVERGVLDLEHSVVVTGIGRVGAAPMALEPVDFVAEPDGLPTYGAIDAFVGRQEQLFALLSEPQLDLHVLTTEGEDAVASVVPRPRGLWTLPTSFWIQLVTGVVSALIAGWVWALRPRQLAPTLFAVSGMGVLLTTLTSAYYAHRGLALPADAYRWLLAVNHAGIFLFGASLIGLFLIYPRRLIGNRWLVLIPLVGGALWLADTFRIGIEAEQYILATITMVVSMFGLIVAQWWATRQAPADRAVLGWLGLSIAVALCVFAMLSLAPDILGFNSPLAQHYAAGAMVLIYVGLALGLRRYRLFELGEWSYRILYYTFGAFLLLALDAALIAGLNLQLAPALAVSLLLVGMVYMPLRSWLWQRLFARDTIQQHELFSQAMEVAFAPKEAESAARWRALVKRLFDPLETEEAGAGVEDPAIGEEGLLLELPAVAGAPALRLRYPFGGAGLFQPADRALAANMVALTERAEESRQAYMRGVGEERRRMARDLHDDVGARLLTGLHTADERTRPTLQAALSDIRAIVSGLTGEEAELELVLAQIRHEAARRLEAAGIDLDWPLQENLPATRLDYRVHKAMTSAVREVVSNVVRHSEAKALHVTEHLTAEQMSLRFVDDGRGLPPQAVTGEAQGFGLKNLRQRFEDIGGSVRFEVENGTSVTLVLPLTLAERTLEPGVQLNEAALDSGT
jgi:two-component system, NarL family, sensor histidine kinase DevS